MGQDEVVDADLSACHQTVPRTFAELFQQMRLRIPMTLSEMAKKVRYSNHTINALETTMRNPTIKTVMRYFMNLDLELTLTKNGITVRDPSTNTTIVENWVPVIE